MRNAVGTRAEFDEKPRIYFKTVPAEFGSSDYEFNHSMFAQKFQYALILLKQIKKLNRYS